MIQMFERERERQQRERKRNRPALRGNVPKKASVQHNSARNRQTQQKDKTKRRFMRCLRKRTEKHKREKEGQKIRQYIKK